jgi:hypothetical protein
MKNRIFKLEHLPPLGVIIHAHQVLKFSYSTEGSENVKKVEKFKFNYKEGNYSKISASILEIDWKNEFKNLNTNEQYEIKWVKIYSNLCNEHIPKIKIRQGRFKQPWLGLDSKIKTLIKEDKKQIDKSKNNQWFKNKNRKISKKKKKEFNKLNKKLQKEIKKSSHNI